MFCPFCSAYHKYADQVSEGLKVVKECNINSSSEIIANKIKEIQLNPDEEIISFDVVSLYTNVPVKEAINDCANLLYSDTYKKPPVDKETFVKLVELCTCNVIMLTHDGLYRQIDGLALGNPPAPLLANGWLSKFDLQVGQNSKLFSRYMDDIIRDIKKVEADQKLAEINTYHPSLKFTMERESDGSIPFLDMKIMNSDGLLSSTWYCKPTDTGITMNFHAMAPTKYKRNVVSGLVHRIYRACSSWNNFHESLVKAKKLLDAIQYPEKFYEPIIENSVNKIIERNHTDVNEQATEPEPEEKENELKIIFVQYRGKITDKFIESLNRLNAPCKVISTIKKLKTVYHL